MNNLREYRERRFWTQEDLAKRVGISRRTITSIENGAGCRAITKRWISEALEVDPETVFPYEPQVEK